ncbi:MAG: restriction endonuclease subunit S [Thiofilum sp.]|nr:restriction endonuclease subunit S [Thiofilum sp.]
MQFPVCPLPEQRAIVAKIDELFSELDNGIANLKAAQAKLDIYRQAVLKQAFEGELTREWRERQTDLPSGELLLNEINKLHIILESSKKKIKTKVIGTPKKDDVPHSIPEKWLWCYLGEVTWFINGDRGKNYPNVNEYVSEGIPWINTGHIRPDGGLHERKMHYITQEKFDSLRSGKIQEGDLIYCLRGATFGKTAFVKPFHQGAIASSLMIIRSTEKINKKYLYFYLTSTEGKQQLLRFDNGSAQPNLSAETVRKYVFPLPSLEEQTQIVQEIEARLSVCDKLAETIQTSLQQAEALRQSILKKAFEGRLLTETELQTCKAQADWMPAEQLLAQIKSTKAKG